ncbi:MAG: hypothetical protein L0241_19680 [Planctomycetia bacterium]|nr:hypothetical protein [Planctomycetia bacterium]
MTFTAVTLLSLTVGQPPAPDYYSMNSRTIRLPIEYKKDRKTIRQVLLYVARNGENTWYQEGFVTPDKDAFVYLAKDDGVYWFKMVIEDLKGNKDPSDLTAGAPDLKMVIDTLPPQVRPTNAKRNGEEVVIEWMVEDKFPNDAETKVHFRSASNPNGFWQEVMLPANSRTGVKFPCGTSEAVVVRITATDVAGNKTESTQEFPAAGNGQTSTSMSPTLPVGPVPPVGPASGTGNISSGNTGMSGGTKPADPVIPVSPGPIAPPTPPGITPTQPFVPVQPTQPHTPPQTGSTNSGMKPLPTIDPKAAPSLPTQGGWNSATGPTVEMTRAQVINYPRFDLGFDLEARGPSGISRVDLWVTRDDGRSWQKWSQHDGKGGAVRVMLDIRENLQLEGSYGFRLVPVSGAGLSEREPSTGDVPELRIVLDVTAPQIDLFPPVSDPNAADTLVIQWKATDKNFGDDPITLEWSEAPGGPWKPVASAANEAIVQVGALATPIARRLPNTGQFGWRVPPGIPARVYLKATAKDAAGNVREVVTREPILVDLTKPRAKISGIVPPVTPRP